MWKPIAELKRDGEFPVEVWHPEGRAGWSPYPRGGWFTFVDRPSVDDPWFAGWVYLADAWFRVVAPPPPSPAADER